MYLPMDGEGRQVRPMLCTACIDTQHRSEEMIGYVHEFTSLVIGL